MECLGVDPWCIAGEWWLCLIRQVFEGPCVSNMCEHTPGRGEGGRIA